MNPSTRLTPAQVSYLRGRLKARKRGQAMESRYAKIQEDVERLRQEKLAKDIRNRIG